jgi:hypothetical protein
MPPKSKPTEFWMDAQQYAELSAKEKKLVSAAIETFDKDVAAAEKKVTDAVADVTNGKYAKKK